MNSITVLLVVGSPDIGTRYHPTMPATPAEPGGAKPPKLLRRLGLADAVLLGLGSMIGTGVFVVFAPAAQAAGTGLLVGLGLAAIVAYATRPVRHSSRPYTRLRAARTCTRRERLGPAWGFLAGIGFIFGKIASCAAAALAVGVYAAPQAPRPSPRRPSCSSPPSTIGGSPRLPCSIGSS